MLLSSGTVFIPDRFQTPVMLLSSVFFVFFSSAHGIGLSSTGRTWSLSSSTPRVSTVPAAWWLRAAGARAATSSTVRASASWRDTPLSPRQVNNPAIRPCVDKSSVLWYRYGTQCCGAKAGHFLAGAGADTFWAGSGSFAKAAGFLYRQLYIYHYRYCTIMNCFSSLKYRCSKI